MPILALGTLAANFSNPIHGNTDRQSFVMVKTIASAAARMRHKRCRLVSWGYTLLSSKHSFRLLKKNQNSLGTCLICLNLKSCTAYVDNIPYRCCSQIHPIKYLPFYKLLLIVARNIKSFKMYQK